MGELKRYTVLYTQTAEEDILAKAEYIEKAFRDSRLAYTWYTRLRTTIEKDLPFLPYKYQLYSVASWAEKGVRVFLYRNDVVLYSVDEAASAVMIHAVFTRGKNYTEDVSEE